MNKKRLGDLGKMVLFVLPFFVGFYGVYMADHGDISECAYKAVQLYLMEYNIEGSTNMAIEIAKWTAPMATVAVILSAIFSFVENVRIWIMTKVKDMIAIHGDSCNIDLVMKNLGSKAIHSEKIMAFRARRHVLMFENDFDMYHFMDEHGTRLLGNKKKQVFLCSDKIQRGNYENNQLVVCNVAENCAREYWKKYPVTHGKEKILIIGFGNYGQKILTQGLLKNIIAVDSSIEYHVTGSGYQTYLAKYHKLHKVVHTKYVDKMGEVKDLKPYDDICDNHDFVYFYDMTWYDVMSRGMEFDRIILAYDTDAQNLDVLNELKLHYVTPVCHIKFEDCRILEALWDLEKQNIVPYGVNEELYEPEIILKEVLFDHAKMIHARYFAKWLCDGHCNGSSCGNKVEDGVCSLRTCSQCPKLLEDWNKLSTFLRYSNVAQADHIQEKLRILLGKEEGIDYLESPGIGKKALEAYKELSYEQQKTLWQIEHIRWNRYHFMNNWDYAEKRDNPNRKHHLLVPFDTLSAVEQEKDADAYIALEELLD